MISVCNLIYQPSRVSNPLVNIASLELQQGLFHAFLGPNGAGKSTLLRCLCGDIRESEHQVSYLDKSLSQYHIDELARVRAVLPQTTPIPFAMSARSIVAFGRDIYRYLSSSKYDTEVIDSVMQWLDIEHLAHQNYQSLSGGEQHRVQIARTLCQVIEKPDISLEDRILFLDEPSNHLDVRHQYNLMRLLKTLQQRGLTIVCVLHDIAMALNYADYLLLLKKGEAVAYSPAQSLLESGVLDQVYECSLNAHWSEHYHRYLTIPSVY